MAPARRLTVRRLLLERGPQVRGECRIELDHPQLIVAAQPLDDASRDGTRSGARFQNFLRCPAVSDIAAQRGAERTAARNDRAGRVVVTKKLCEESLVIG